MEEARLRDAAIELVSSASGTLRFYIDALDRFTNASTIYIVFNIWKAELENIDA